VKPAIFLRVASILTLIHAVLHTVGGVFGQPKNGSEQLAVIETMKAHQFLVMGSSRSYWDFFFGYGLILSICLLVEAVLFWQLSDIAKKQPQLTRPILAAFIAAFCGSAVIAGRYFFAGPAITEVLIAICLAAAYATAGGLPAQKA
jgi:hypothetical protein